MLHSSYPHSHLHSTITSTNNNLNHDHWITNLHSLLFIVEWSSDGLSDLQSPALTLSSVSCPPIHHVSTRIVLIEWVPINDQSFHQMLGLEPGVELIRSWAYISAPGLIGLTLFLKWLRSALASSSWSLKSTLIPATALHIPTFRSHISHCTHFWAVYTRRWGRQRRLHQLNCYHHSRVKTRIAIIVQQSFTFPIFSFIKFISWIIRLATTNILHHVQIAVALEKRAQVWLCQHTHRSTSLQQLRRFGDDRWSHDDWTPLVCIRLLTKTCLSQHDNTFIIQWISYIVGEYKFGMAWENTDTCTWAIPSYL